MSNVLRHAPLRKPEPWLCDIQFSVHGEAGRLPRTAVASKSAWSTVTGLQVVKAAWPLIAT
jgi:hypothetical protein